MINQELVAIIKDIASLEKRMERIDRIETGSGSGPAGFLVNGQIVPSVAGNNLTVAIKTLAGADPSPGNPVYVRLGNTVLPITATLSVTVNAGTNWFNSGGAELATKAVDYFVYLGYNSTDGVVIGVARFPHALTYNNFSVTTTNQYYAAISNITHAISSDGYYNIGRFNAILSATPSFNWSAPGTYVIINRPIFESRWLTWNPAFSANGAMTYTLVTINYARYKVLSREYEFRLSSVGTTGGTANTELRGTAPWNQLNAVAVGLAIPAYTADGGASMASFGYVGIGTPDIICCRRTDGSNYGLGGNRTINAWGIVEI